MGGDSMGNVELDPRVDLLAGSVAGVAALTVGFPFDTVKVRLQNPEFASKYGKSVWHAFTTIVREERMRGLFRGIASPLMTSAPLNGVVFASYRFFLNLQLSPGDTNRRPGISPTLTQVTLAGVACGLLAATVTSPTELIKIQQQSIIVPRFPSRGAQGMLSTAPARPEAPLRAPTTHDVALEIWRRRGIRGVFRGFVPTALRETGYGAYFGVYEATLRYLSPSMPTPMDPDYEKEDTWSLSSFARKSYPVLLAGGLAGPISWLVTFPFDVVKTRVQSSLSVSAENPFRSTWSTIVHSYRTEGPGVYFRGLKPTLIRAVPVNMVTFATFELVVHALS